MDIALTYEGSVAVLTWNEGENRINLDSLARLNELLDDIENVDGPVSLVLTGSGKFFCNGLDLARFADKRDEFTATLHSLEQTIGRLLIFPAYTGRGDQTDTRSPVVRLSRAPSTIESCVRTVGTGA